MPKADSKVPTFHGRYRHGVDGSRRIMIPAKWRPPDKRVLYMAILWPINVNDCILVLPPDGWQEKILDKLKSNSLHDEQAAILRRVLGETSAPLELDRIGRFGLSENLANGVGLEKGGEAVFVGCVTNFEIWNSKRFDAAAPYDKSQAADFAKKIL